MKCAVLLLGLLAVGCVFPEHKLGPFVRDFRIAGDLLIVQRCVVDWSSGKLELSSCTDETRLLPQRAAPPRTGLEPIQVGDGVTATIRDGVHRCGAVHRVGGAVSIVVIIEPDGRVASATASSGVAGFGACVETVFSTARFVKSEHRTRAVIPFDLPGLPADLP